MAYQPKHDANDYKVVPKPSAARNALRERLASKKPKGEIVTVDLGGGESLILEARRPTAGAKWRIQEMGYVPDPKDDGKNVMVPSRFWPAIFAAVFHVPETGEPMWYEGEEHKITELDASITDALLGPALRALGDTQEVRDDLKNGSSEADTAASSSTSPAS